VNGDRAARIEALLTEAFAPSHLQVKDQSHLHAGHAGAQDGRGHYDVRIVSTAFAGKRPLARHRMVYEALGSMMETDIHALRIDASAPPEGN
jgi:BolA protein